MTAADLLASDFATLPDPIRAYATERELDDAAVYAVPKRALRDTLKGPAA